MMEQKFLLSCESTVDLPYRSVHGRGIEVLFYTYTVEGAEYVDDMGRNADALPNFYKLLSSGKIPATSQINAQRYLEFLEPLVQQGDVLHIAFGSGMSASVQNAYAAAQELREKYPHRKLIVVDSLCSSTGYGMLVESIADIRDAGAAIEEAEKWVLENRNRVHHQFFSTDLTQFKRSGRVSGPAAAVGTILNICPIMHLNSEGRIIAYAKVRGIKKAIQETVDTVTQHIQDGAAYRDKLYICHSNCYALAEQTRQALAQQLGVWAETVPIVDIGTIIAAHCGPGTVAVFFYGDEREK